MSSKLFFYVGPGLFAPRSRFQDHIIFSVLQDHLFPADAIPMLQKITAHLSDLRLRRQQQLPHSTDSLFSVLQKPDH